MNAVTLSRRGFTVLGGIMGVPLLGLFANLPLPMASAGVAAFGALFSLKAVLEWQTLRRLIQETTLSLPLPERLQVSELKALAPLLSSERPFPTATVQVQLPESVQCRFEPNPLEFQLTRNTTNSPAQLQLVAQERGDLFFTHVWSRWTLKGGFVVAQRQIPVSGVRRVPIFPQHDGALSNPPLNNPAYLGQRRLFLSGGEGKEFDHLRGYTKGDDLRRVDWKRSARRGSLSVRVYRPETHQRLYMAFDCSRRMSSRILGRTQLSYALDAGAQLARLALEEGDEVGLFSFHRRAGVSVPARTGIGHGALLFEALRELQETSFEPDYSQLIEWGQSIRRRSLIVLFTSASMPASIDAAGAALGALVPKHLPLLVTISNEELQHCIEKRVANWSDAYFVSTAVEQDLAIERRLQKLKDYGVEVLRTDAPELRRGVTERYARLKVAGKL